MHARQDDALPADPHVAADDDIPLERKLAEVRRRVFRPCPAEHRKGIRRHAAQTVVRRAHDKFHAGGDRAEFADHQPVAEFRVIKKHVVLFKASRILRVIVIRVVAHENVGCSNNIFYEACRAVIVRKHDIRVWNYFHIIFRSFYFCSASPPLPL